MSSLFASFSPGPVPDVSDLPDGPVINSEMDDLPLPEGADLPSAEDTRKTIELVNLQMNKIGAPTSDEFVPMAVNTAVGDQSSVSADKTPVQQRPAVKEPTELIRQSSSYYETPVGESSGPDSDQDDHLLSEDRLDVLSAASEVSGHRKQLRRLTTQLAQLDAKVDNMVSMDSKIRKLESTLSEHTTRLDSISTSFSNLSKSFTMYQTNMASKIADVERRHATKQLSVDAPTTDNFVVPPSDIDIVRDTVTLPVTGPALPSSIAAPKIQKKRADLSGW